MCCFDKDINLFYKGDLFIADFIYIILLIFINTELYLIT